jgi:hypothetical protein
LGADVVSSVDEIDIEEDPPRAELTGVLQEISPQRDTYRLGGKLL